MKKAQVMIEFTFTILIVVLLMYGMIRAFQWVGSDLGHRRAAYDQSLAVDIDEDWSDKNQGPLKQFTTNFYKPAKMSLVFNKW